MKKILLALLVIASTQGYAQEKPLALTDVQKLQIQNAAQTMEIWQLKAQQAVSEFEKARDNFQKIVAASTPPGYVITDKLELVPKPELKPEPKPKTEDK